MEIIENALVGIWTVVTLTAGCMVLLRCFIFFVEVNKHYKYLLEKKDDKEHPVTHESLDKFINDTMKQYSPLVTHVIVAVCVLSYIAYQLEQTEAKVLMFIIAMSFLAYALYCDIRYKVIKKYIDSKGDAYGQLGNKSKKGEQDYIQALREADKLH